ncbi:MAG: hypothetical protein IMZ43_11025 [Thermoplasmata archaeon]|nr:hypothetical protein [Thermoplasmata archaeon]
MDITVIGNGSVDSNPEEPKYVNGAIVELNANADSGWIFSHWSGDLNGSTNPATIIILTFAVDRSFLD